MSAQTQPAVSVVAAERGSLWAPWVRRFRELTPGAVELLVQRANESSTEFAQRVRVRVGELVARGHALPQAVFVGAGAGGAKGLAESLPVTVRALAQCVARAGGGRVYLDGRRADRRSLAAIAGVVGDMVSGTGVVVEALPAVA